MLTYLFFTNTVEDHDLLPQQQLFTRVSISPLAEGCVRGGGNKVESSDFKMSLYGERQVVPKLLPHRKLIILQTRASTYSVYTGIQTRRWLGYVFGIVFGFAREYFWIGGMNMFRRVSTNQGSGQDLCSINECVFCKQKRRQLAQDSVFWTSSCLWGQFPQTPVLLNIFQLLLRTLSYDPRFWFLLTWLELNLVLLKPSRLSVLSHQIRSAFAPLGSHICCVMLSIRPRESLAQFHAADLMQSIRMSCLCPEELKSTPTATM